MHKQSYQMDYPNRLKDLREEKGKNQKTVAEAINVHQTTLSKYENGTTDIPTRVLKDLAKYFETSVDYILLLTDQKKPY